MAETPSFANSGNALAEQYNQLRLSACIVQTQALRYTPAGLPALDMQLEHACEQPEAGVLRKVQLTLKAVAFGTLAERLERQPLGSRWAFSGFLAAGRGGKGVVFHIQGLQQD